MTLGPMPAGETSSSRATHAGKVLRVEARQRVILCESAYASFAVLFLFCILSCDICMAV